MLKKTLKKLLAIFCLSHLPRVWIRYKFGMTYYQSQLSLLKKWIWLDTEDTNFYYKLTTINQDQLAQAISLVAGKSYEVIRGYFKELEDDVGLREHIKERLSVSDYGNDIQVDFGRRLGWYALARCMKPKIIIETGVEHGVGACVLTSALMRNALEGEFGRYYGTEIKPESGKLLTGKYSDFGEILYGDSIETLKKLNVTIDLFVNDSDHSAEYEYREYRTVIDKLSLRGCILGDNSHVSDSLSKFSRETNRNFLFFSEKPLNHWYPGAGIGISFPK